MVLASPILVIVTLVKTSKHEKFMKFVLFHVVIFALYMIYVICFYKDNDSGGQGTIPIPMKPIVCIIFIEIHSVIFHLHGVVYEKQKIKK